MEESKIKAMIKEKYIESTDKEIEEIYETLVEENLVPKNEEEMQELFIKLDEIEKIHTIDDSEDADIDNTTL